MRKNPIINGIKIRRGHKVTPAVAAFKQVYVEHTRTSQAGIEYTYYKKMYTKNG